MQVILFNATVGFLIGNIIIYHSKVEMGYKFIAVILFFTIAGFINGLMFFLYNNLLTNCFNSF
jgi:hypothetical protein